jgi:hypothetical protein
MNIKTLISSFIAQICEKKYATANSTLKKIVTEKVKQKVEKIKK